MSFQYSRRARKAKFCCPLVGRGPELFCSTRVNCRGYKDVTEFVLVVWLDEDNEGVNVPQLPPYALTLNQETRNVEPIKKFLRVGHVRSRPVEQGIKSAWETGRHQKRKILVHRAKN